MPNNVNWTYSGDQRKSDLDKIRSLIGDTDATKPWTLTDPEIMANAADAPENLYLAAAYCVEAITAKLKGTVADKTVGDLSITYNANMLSAFVSLSNTLRNRATLRAVPYNLGGSSYAQKRAQDLDPDRVAPAIKIDGMDYIFPISNEGDGTQGQ